MIRITTLFGAALLTACASPPPPRFDPASPADVRDVAAQCPALAQQALPLTRIVKATLVPAGSTRPPGVAAGVTTGGFLPEHCIVQGAIRERTGADGKPYAIGFELRLPSQWNGRFFYQGGGGNDGVVNPAIGRNTGALGAVDNGLARGFAVVSTDAGHGSPAPDFGLDPQARIDHAYAAYPQVAETAKLLIAAYYGKRPDKSYFVGCSGGGRQGMLFSQKYPEVFDGIVATAPAMRVAKGATISVAWSLKHFLAAAPAGADGKPVLAQTFSPADLSAVAGGILEACDAADGAQDGLVSNPAACRFDAAKLQCAGADTATKQAGCLSAPQVSALKAFLGGPKNSAGQPLYTTWPADPGIAAPGWRAWTLGSAATGPSDARYLTLMQGALGYEFMTPPQPGFDITRFDFDRDPARLDAFNDLYETARDDRLTAYEKRGGKLLFFHGMADPIFSADEMVDYFSRLAANHGGTTSVQAFARLFLVPGMTHCSGGPATDAYDGLSAIVGWVEESREPRAVMARGTAERPELSRPLCPYPLHTHYLGGGDINDAGNFVCR